MLPAHRAMTMILATSTPIVASRCALATLNEWPPNSLEPFYAIVDTPAAQRVASRHLATSIFEQTSPPLVGNNGRPGGTGRANFLCNNSNCAAPAWYGRSWRNTVPRHKLARDLVHPTASGSVFVTSSFNETVLATTLISMCSDKAAAASISLIMKNVASTRKLPPTGAPGGILTLPLVTV